MTKARSTVWAVLFGVGLTAVPDAATAGARATFSQVQGGGPARSSADLLQLAQAGKPAKPPPNDVFTLYQAIGPWRVVKVYRDGKFHRCRAELGSVPNQLLIVKWATRNWGIAIANTGNLGPTTRHKMTMEIGRSSQAFDGLIDVYGLYLAKTVPQGTIDAIRGASRFQLTTPMGTQSWNLTNTSAMAGSLDDCFKENSGNS